MCLNLLNIFGISKLILYNFLGQWLEDYQFNVFLLINIINHIIKKILFWCIHLRWKFESVNFWLIIIIVLYLIINFYIFYCIEFISEPRSCKQLACCDNRKFGFCWYDGSWLWYSRGKKLSLKPNFVYIKCDIQNKLNNKMVKIKIS